jgi:hypothetical protein
MNIFLMTYAFSSLISPCIPLELCHFLFLLYVIFILNSHTEHFPFDFLQHLIYWGNLKFGAKFMCKSTQDVGRPNLRLPILFHDLLIE